MKGGPQHLLGPATFFSVVEVQALVRTQEAALRTRNPGTAGTGTEVAVLFSEVVGSAAEHWLTNEGASVHVRYLPDQTGIAN